MCPSPPVLSTSTMSSNLSDCECLLYAEWNNRGVDLILAAAYSSSQALKEQQQELLLHGLICFNKALKLGQSTHLRTAINESKDTPLTSTLKRKNGKLQIGLSQRDCSPNNNFQSGEHFEDNSISCLFTRLFVFSSASPPVSFSLIDAPSTDVCAMHCAAIIFNMALTNHLMSLCSDYHPGHLRSDHPESRLRISMELYHHCWYLICMVVAGVESGEEINTSLCHVFDPMVSEVLILSCLNNMALASHELAHYQRSIQCFAELYVVLESTYSRRHREVENEETLENQMLGSVDPPFLQTATTSSRSDGPLDVEDSFTTLFLGSSLSDRVFEGRTIDTSENLLIGSILEAEKLKFTQNMFVYLFAADNAPAA